MDRLTKRVGVGEAIPVADGNICTPFIKAGLCLTGCETTARDGTYRFGWQRHCNDECELGMMIDRLAAYEDTGLTPDEVAELKTENERLRAELDAAVADLFTAADELQEGVGACAVCKNLGNSKICNECAAGMCLFKWRGTEEWLAIRTVTHDGEPYCSVCGEEPYRKSDRDFPNFCPNCGADMRTEV